MPVNMFVQIHETQLLLTNCFNGLKQELMNNDTCKFAHFVPKDKYMFTMYGFEGAVQKNSQKAFKTA